MAVQSGAWFYSFLNGVLKQNGSPVYTGPPFDSALVLVRTLALLFAVLSLLLLSASQTKQRKFKCGYCVCSGAKWSETIGLPPSWIDWNPAPTACRPSTRQQITATDETNLPCPVSSKGPWVCRRRAAKSPCSDGRARTQPVAPPSAGPEQAVGVPPGIMCKGVPGS